MIVEQGSVCGSCSPYFRDPRACEWCGQLSLRLARSKKDGIFDLVCPKCINARTKINCPGCGHSRRPYKLNEKGVVICKSCFEKGPFNCPVCKKKDVQRYSDHECWDCSNTRRMRIKIKDTQEILRNDYLHDVVREYGLHLLQTNAVSAPFKRFDRDIPFYTKLDALFDNPLEIDALTLCEHFGRNGLRRYTVALGFLNRSGVIPNYKEGEFQEAGELTAQKAIITRAKGQWYASLLENFHKELIEDHLRKLSRNNESSAKSITSALRAAEKLVIFASECCDVTSQTGLTNRAVETFVCEKQGYRFAVRRFIDFLNMRARRFGGAKIKIPVPKSDDMTHGMPLTRQRKLYKEWIAAEGKETRRAVVGIFALLFAQKGRDIARMRLSQIAQRGPNSFMVTFAKIALPIDGPEGELLSRYLAYRPAESHLDTPESNPYLFPGRRYDGHITAATISGYISEWRTNANELFSGALIQIIESGINNPSLLRDGYGVSNVTAAKYLRDFGVQRLIHD